LPRWQAATWDDYVALRDALTQERVKLSYNQGWLWTEMGAEGINHAGICDLFTMLFAFWAVHHPEELYSSMGRCLLEKEPLQACAPDLVLYVGADFPMWQEGEPRRINLQQWRVPDLVGEIADTTLANDLDEQKHLYAALGIPEYWVIDVRGRRVFAFRLENGEYKPCEQSQALSGCPIDLLEKVLEKVSETTNTSAAAWFAQQISAS
jgi:Uma2 family endonuclease